MNTFIFSSERSVDEKEFFGMECRKIDSLLQIIFIVTLSIYKSIQPNFLNSIPKNHF
jgi:hypothetical protein